MRSHIPALAALFAAAAQASTTAAWEMNSFQEFLRGRFSNVALTRDGRMSLAPQLDRLFTSGQPEIWAAARGADGALYLATGHRGRVFKVDAAGTSTTLWTADQPEVFAIAVDSRGAVYAGTSPEGRVYRIEGGRASEFFNPGARYIWALAIAPDGAMFVATGDPGRVFRVTPDGKSELYFDSGQQHITALAIDVEGRLLAGSEPNGILYRFTAPNKAFVLYDANLPEIRSILPAADGSVYVAALGGATAKRAGNAYGASSAAGGAMMTAPATSVTVTDSASAQAGPDIKAPKPDAAKAAVAQPQATQAVQATSAVEVAGVEKSAIYKIYADNTVETLWSSKEENVYDLVASDNRLTFSTDVEGRVYRLGSDRKTALLAETGEGEALRLVPSNGGLMVATGSTGRLYRLTGTAATSGYYEAPVHDANTVARWGRLSWHQDKAAGKVRFRTRAGNSARPDNTWSEWSAPMDDPRGSLIQSPNARYLQWRAEFESASGIAPSIDSVTAAYAPQNTPPTLRSITVATVPKPATAVAAAAAAPVSSFSITVTDTGDAAATSAGTPTQMLTRSAQQQTQVSWQADDPDGDRLVYTVSFRGEDEAEWKLLKANLFENSLSLDSDILADGRYYFRVVASDRPSNPPQYARESELASAPVLVDNTPPVVRIAAPARDGATADISVEATDTTSPLRRCEYSLDAAVWVPVEAADGVADSLAETFKIHLTGLTTGERLLVVRVYDAAGNAGLAKVVLR